MVVQDYVQNGLSLDELAAKYNISSKTVIDQWIKRYNNHIEQRDYCPHPEVYMAERKKTTKEERMEIVQYCINHDRNYKETAAKYGCSYSQVYSWVRKYDRQGTDGLNDNRGHRKAEEDLTDMERLERENKRLKEEPALRHRVKIQIYQSVQETSSDEQCSIQYLCQLAGISRASYYKWIHRKPSRVDIEDARILPTSPHTGHCR